MSYFKTRLAVTGYFFVIIAVLLSEFKDYKQIGAFSIFAFFWLVVQVYNKKHGQLFLHIWVVGCAFWAAMVLSGISDIRLNMDQERIFVIDNKYAESINNVKSESVDIPYKVRPLLFNQSIIAINVLGRSLSIIWIDKILHIYGIIFAFAAIYGIFRYLNKFDTSLLVIGAAIFALSRDPNIKGFYFLFSPIYFKYALKVVFNNKL